MLPLNLKNGRSWGLTTSATKIYFPWDVTPCDLAEMFEASEELATL